MFERDVLYLELGVKIMSLVLLCSGAGVVKWEKYFGFTGQTNTVDGITPGSFSTGPFREQDHYKFSSFFLIER